MGVINMRKTTFLICRVVVLIFIIIKLSANLTYANIINVPGDYPTIQQGLDYAIAGDTVLVATGIYLENIIWPAMNGIKLIGEAGQDSTIINGDGLASVIRFEEDLGGIIDGTTVIEGFTITNGNAQGDWPESEGGGIFCWESNPSLYNVTITSNTATETNLYGGYGGGICCTNNSSPSLENVIITGNYASHSGGGIACRYNSYTSLEDVTITGNSAFYRGGGIYCGDNCSPSLENVTITGNSASYDGGGINCSSNCSPSLENVTITGNYASLSGGGISCLINSSPSLSNITISENIANEGGGISCYWNSNPILLNSILWNDSPQEIYFSVTGSPNSITIAYSDIQGGESAIVTNSNGTVNWLDGNIDADPLFADPANGDFHLTWTNFPIHDSTKSPCIDTGDPSSSPDPDGTYADMGALYFDQGPHIPPGDVSGIWTIDNSPYFIGGEINIPVDSTLVIEPGVQVIFSGHYKFNIYGRLLAEGAATDTIVFTAQDTTVGWHGLRFYDTDLTGQDSSKVVYCKLEYGKAIGNFPDNCGGAIFCYYSSDIFINNSIITNSTAFHGGGAYFYWYSSPNLLNVTISNNSAFSSGGGIGLYLYSSPSLTNVTISKNTTAYGGGIHCYNNCNPNLSNVTVSNNLAISYGGGIYCVNNANPSLVNSILWDNSPQEICFSEAAGTNSITIAYSDVEGDSAGIVTNNNGIVNWLDGNINADPLFADPESGDFHLTWVNFPIHDSTKSPCIDTGDPSSSPDPDGTYADMGALYFDQGPHIPPGDVSGTWNYANSPYYIGGEINIPTESTLMIEPGVQVIFSGHYKFNIYGRLLAEGTANDTIVFTAQDTTLGWHGLRFICSNWQGSKVVYCKLEYGRATVDNWYGGAIYCYNSSDIIIKNCLIAKNSTGQGGGIYFHWSSPFLKNVTITGNSAAVGGGIYCMDSSPSLENVAITGNSANSGGGICCSNASNPILTNVTISRNNANSYGGGIYSLFGSTPSLFNCILWNDAPQEVYFSDIGNPNSITISYTDIQGGEAGIVTNNNGTVNWLDGNIDVDPLFADPENGDFHLTWASFPIPDSTMSPCIDTGDPDSQYDDPDATRNDMGALYFDQSPPGIISITDVPNDQGKQVQVVWHRSSLDIPYSPTPIISYSVWRFDEIFERKSSTFICNNPLEILKQANREEDYLYYWQKRDEILTFITQLPAIQIEQYSVIAPTLFDSSATSCNYSKFEVIAHTDTVWVYFESEPDSGYSVDNLAPSAPQGFNGFIVGNQVELYWQPCPDEDFQYYAIYKSNESSNYPDEPYATTIDTFYIDTNITYDPIYYVLTAFDYNGNESEYSEELLVTLIDIDDNISDIPEHYSISQNYPNPFKTTTSIRYAIPELVNIKFEIYNIKGQLVETLINEDKPAGYHTIEWNISKKSDISSGLYFYKLITKDKTLIKKMVLMR